MGRLRRKKLLKKPFCTFTQMRTKVIDNSQITTHLLLINGLNHLYGTEANLPNPNMLLKFQFGVFNIENSPMENTYYGFSL